MSRYELALQEVRSVLSEWIDMVQTGQRADSPWSRNIVAEQIVERLIAKGVIQSTDPDDLLPTGYVEPVLSPRADNERPT